MFLGRAFEWAGYVAYTGLLALFPFILFLASMPAYFTSYASSEEAIWAVFAMLPARIAETVAPIVTEVLKDSQGALAPIGLLGALWVASGGIDGLRQALVEAYAIPDKRPYWRLKLESLAAVLLGGLSFILLSVLIVLGPLLWHLFEVVLPPFAQDKPEIYDFLRYLSGAIVMIAVLLMLHRWLPVRRLPFRRLLPGVVITTLLWLLMAGLFSLYLKYLNDYSATYGSLGGIIATLFFFYVSALLLILGGEFNAALDRLSGQGRRRRLPHSLASEVRLAEE